MTGFSTDNKVGVYAYLTVATGTVIGTSNQFELISGTFENDPFEGFTLGTNVIIYQGQSGVTFEVDWHSSFSSGTANNTIHFGVSINGQTLTTDMSTGVVGTFAKNANQVYNIGGTQVVTLNKGDTIQLQVTGSVATTISVKHYSTTISKFYRGKL